LKSLLTILICGVILSLTACGSLSTTELSADEIAEAHRPQGENLKEEVDSVAQPLINNGHTPGMIVGVLLPDKSMQFFGYGVADEDTGAKPNGDTLFAIGSLSKGFLGAMTALLVDEGALSWDDTLRTLLPPNTPLSDDAAKITLLQLATHTSGLPRQPLRLKTLSYFVEYLFNGENFYRHIDRDYILHYLADFEADNEGQPHYSNIGYGLLGYILELRTGLSVDELLEQKLRKPLGLKCTGYNPEVLPCYATRAHGYAGDHPMFIPRGDPTPDWQFTHVMRGSAALYSNTRDLLTFASAHIWNQKRRFNTVLASDMRPRSPREKEAPAIAWVVDTLEGEPIAYQIGIVAGYTSYIGIDITHKTAVVIMQNSFNWNNSIGHNLLLNLRYMTP
jgi:CubicO group peptidase (beta-lactamase class C family)